METVCKSIGLKGLFRLPLRARRVKLPKLAELVEEGAKDPTYEDQTGNRSCRREAGPGCLPQ